MYQVEKHSDIQNELLGVLSALTHVTQMHGSGDGVDALILEGLTLCSVRSNKADIDAADINSSADGVCDARTSADNLSRADGICDAHTSDTASTHAAALQSMVQRAKNAKKTLSPGCMSCPSPCGNTANYDMQQLPEESDRGRSLKLEMLEILLEEVQERYAAHDRDVERTLSDMSSEQIALMHKVLFYLSIDTDENYLDRMMEELHAQY